MTAKTKWLWIVFVREGLAIRAAERLSRSPLLTPAEQEQMREIMHDEARHRDVAYELAKVSGPRPADLIEDREWGDDLHLLHLMNRGESLFLRTYYADIRPVLTPEQQIALDGVFEDEKRHRKIGKAILHRIGERRMGVLRNPGHEELTSTAREMIEEARG